MTQQANHVTASIGRFPVSARDFSVLVTERSLEGNGYATFSRSIEDSSIPSYPENVRGKSSDSISFIKLF
jgi:hypothetical protein